MSSNPRLSPNCQTPSVGPLGKTFRAGVQYLSTASFLDGICKIPTCKNKGPFGKIRTVEVYANMTVEEATAV